MGDHRWNSDAPEFKIIEKASEAYLQGAPISKVLEFGYPADIAFGKIGVLTSAVAARIFMKRFPSFPPFRGGVPVGGYREVLDLPPSQSVTALGYTGISSMDPYDVISLAVNHYFWNMRDVYFLEPANKIWRGVDTVFTKVLACPPNDGHAFLGPLLSCLTRKEWLQYEGPRGLMSRTYTDISSPMQFSSDPLLVIVSMFYPPIVFDYLVKGASVVRKDGEYGPHVPYGRGYGEMSPVLMLADTLRVDDSPWKEVLSDLRFHKGIYDYIIRAFQYSVEWSKRELTLRIPTPFWRKGQYLFIDAVGTALIKLSGWSRPKDPPPKDPSVLFQDKSDEELGFGEMSQVLEVVRGLTHASWFRDFIQYKVSPFAGYTSRKYTLGDCFAIGVAQTGRLIGRGRIKTNRMGIEALDEALVGAITQLPYLTRGFMQLPLFGGDNAHMFLKNSLPRFYEHLSLSHALSAYDYNIDFEEFPR